MGYYKIIKESLEHIEQIPNTLGKKNLFLSVGIEPLDKGIPKDSIIFPIMEIHPIRNKLEEVIDYKFTMHLLFPSQDEFFHIKKYEELNTSKFGDLFIRTQYEEICCTSEVEASLGKDLSNVASIVSYYINLYVAEQKLIVSPSYNFQIIQKGLLGKIIHQEGIKSSIAVFNAIETAYKVIGYQVDVVYMDILLNERGYAYRLGEIMIFKDNEDVYHATLRSGTFLNDQLKSNLKRFSDYPNKECLKTINIHKNKWNFMVEFKQDQFNDFIYLISDFLKMVYPSLKEENMMAQLNYYNHPLTIPLCLRFLPNGDKPTENELNYVKQLLENFAFIYKAGIDYMEIEDLDEGEDLEEYFKNKRKESNIEK